jgi:hypothetical protein
MILPGMLLPLGPLRPNGVLGLPTHAMEMWMLTAPETALPANTQAAAT